MVEHEVLDLRKIFNIFKRRKWILTIIPLVTIITSAIISFYALTPTYQACTTIMVGNIYHGENDRLIQYNDLLTANQLVKTYSEIAKSRTVNETILKNEKLSLTPEEFSKKIMITPVAGTQLIDITVEDPNPNKAAHLANETAKIFMVKVVNIMKFNNVQVVDEAIPPLQPVKPNKKLNIAIAGILGFMTAIGLVILLEYINQTLSD